MWLTRGTGVEFVEWMHCDARVVGVDARQSVFVRLHICGFSTVPSEIEGRWQMTRRGSVWGRDVSSWHFA